MYLPVRLLERTVSRDVAAANFSCSSGEALGLARHQPHRAGPRARGAERHHRGHLPAGDDAARGEHGYRTNRSACADHFRHEYQRRDFAAVTAGFGAFGDDDVDAGLHLADRVLLRADERSDRDSLRVAPRSIIVCGGKPSALAISLIGM